MRRRRGDERCKSKRQTLTSAFNATPRALRSGLALALGTGTNRRREGCLKPVKTNSCVNSPSNFGVKLRRQKVERVVGVGLAG